MTYSTTYSDLKEFGCDLYSLAKSREAAGNPLGENETLFVSVDGDDVQCGTSRQGMAAMEADDAVVFIDRIVGLIGAHRAEEIEFTEIPW